MNYFAYGSNMDQERMKTRGAPFSERKHAVLEGYTLKFNKVATAIDAKKGEGKGNIERDITGAAIVEGVLYTITSAGLSKLDRCEGYPGHYDRREIDVRTDEGTKVRAWVYIAQPDMVVEGLKPTREYLSHYLKGKDLLSPNYYNWLEKTEILV